jgi:predicted flap endonuclease-1-like 5' DNA nuclease
MATLTDIEGVGETYAEELSAAGLKTVEALLENGATPTGRKTIAAQSGISETLILRWVNHADLFRIKGVAGQFAELLEAAGVDTVVELGHRNAANLQIKMEEVNAERNLVNRVPSEPEIAGWIEEAKTLPRQVSY